MARESVHFAPLCRSCLQGGVVANCNTGKKGLVHPTATGVWETELNYVYYLDLRLADELVNFFTSEESDITEFGAGHGCYTFHLASRNVSVRAFDGLPNIANVTHNLVRTADLSQKMKLGKTDWVICMEVAEHVPQKYEDALIYNLDEHNRKGILLSWSNLKPPHGNGHVNVRSETWVKERFAALGYAADGKATKQLRQAARFPWFKTNLLVLRRTLV